MTESDFLDQGKMKSQSSIAIDWLERHNDYLQNLKSVYANASEVEMLGETYEKISEQCANYVYLINAFQTANNCDKEDHTYMRTVLGDMTFDGSHIIPTARNAHEGENRERRLAESDRRAAAAAKDSGTRKMYADLANNHDRMADSYRAEWQLMEKYMARYDRVNAQTKDLFAYGNQYRAIAKEGVDSIAWAFNPATKSYNLGNEDWKGKLTDLDAKVCSDYDACAKKMAESWSLKDMSKIIQKDAEEVSVREYLALCYGFDNMSDKEKEKFIDSAYIETDYWDSTKMDYQYGGQYAKAKHEYTASTSFLAFSQIYRTKNNASVAGYTDEQIHNGNILYVFSELNPVLYTTDEEGNHKKDLGIIISHDKEITTVTIGADQVLSGQAKGQVYRLNKFDAEDLDYYVDITVSDYTNVVAEGVDAGYVFTGGETWLGLAAANPVASKVTIGIGVFEAIRTYYGAKAAKEDAIKLSKNVNNTLDYGNLLNKLEIQGSVINRRDEGNYSVHVTNIKYNEEHINGLINEWNATHPNQEIKCTAGEFVETFFGNDDAVDSNTMDAFLTSLLPSK